MTTKKQIIQILNEAWELRGEGNYEESKKLLAKAQELCQSNDFNILGRIYHIYMQHEYDHDNVIKALEFNNESISYYTKAENSDKIAHSIRHRADLQTELGQLDKSETNYIKAIEIYKSKLNTQDRDMANALRGYALIQEKRKMFEKAISIWEEIRDLYDKHQFIKGVREADKKINQLSKYDL